MSGNSATRPPVAIVMGSRSDWDTLRIAGELLTEFAVDHHVQVVSAHRTPDLLFEFAECAIERGFKLIIAGAGGAAHLPGMLAAKTPLPVLGVPVQSKTLSGLDSLLSIVQMPKGIPVPTFAIGSAGAANAALCAVSILSLSDPLLAARLVAWRQRQTDAVLVNSDPREPLQ